MRLYSRTDKIYAMSSFLQFRRVPPNIRFAPHLNFPTEYDTSFQRIPVKNAETLDGFLKEFFVKFISDGKCALALSGGMDSAILAKFMPAGSVAYTFKYITPGKNVTDETEQVKRYCDENGLEQRVVEVAWDDYEKYAPILMQRKNAPIHSIEIQVHKAALRAKAEGFDRLLFGENADIVFGGMDELLSKDFTIGDFIEKCSYVLPYKALRKFEIVTEPFLKYTANGFVDAHGFINDILFKEANNTYSNACEAAGVEYIAPFSHTSNMNFDIERIRKGESKYLVREVFSKLYPGWALPEKFPISCPVDEWLGDWMGPKRLEFWENCHLTMSGDQKYYIWILEKFLDMIDKEL